jgi:catechol 2,3-dioxygenase-like lactoylglutathione lyase family enzyme
VIDHVSIPVRRLAESADFYEPVLRTIGLARLVERRSTVGFGKKYAEFWLNARPDKAKVPESTGNHVCLRAPNEASVKLFHEKALAMGGRDAGEPGLRKASKTVYFGAFVFDLDGNKIEVVTFPRD